VIFQDFPGPGIFKKKNPGLSRRRGNPEYGQLRKCQANGRRDTSSIYLKRESPGM